MEYLGIFKGGLIHQKRHMNFNLAYEIIKCRLAFATIKHIVLVLIFTKPRVRMELHKTWERSMMFKSHIQEQGNQERGAKQDLLPV